MNSGLLPFLRLLLGALIVDAQPASPAFLMDDEVSVTGEFRLMGERSLREGRGVVVSCCRGDCPTEANGVWAGTVLREAEVGPICVGPELLADVLLRTH